jgi:SAM-dependent methyltransferase
MTWAADLLNAPGDLHEGVFRFSVAQDPNIELYREIGGAHFHERADVPFSMSALDTPVYHNLLRSVEPPDADDVIVDIGGGDGRNARPWLERGYRRVVVVDAAGDALVRFRRRIASEHPEWLDRLALIEGDARTLPIRSGAAHVVLAIESLYYLNDDYERGLGEALRILGPGGALVLSERDFEGALVARLLYDGPAAMLETARSGSHQDGPRKEMRTRTFTENQLVELLTARGARIESIRGIPLVPLLAGWLRERGGIPDDASRLLPEVVEVLHDLAARGRLRRCHVVVARR